MATWKLYTYNLLGSKTTGWEVNTIHSSPFECEADENGYDAWQNIRAEMLKQGELDHRRKIGLDQQADNTETIYLVNTAARHGGYKPVGELRKV